MLTKKEKEAITDRVMQDCADTMNDILESHPLYKDSGSWQMRTDDMEEVIIQQSADEPFWEFIFRCQNYSLSERAKVIYPE